MKKNILIIFVLLALPFMASAQTDKILNFDYEADGPWNDPEITDMEVPKVPNGAVVLDGQVSAAEYGGFESIDIIPAESGWPLNWPPEREWDGPEDSSFKFYMAHDEEYIYLGVDVMDDVLSQDAAEPTQFWQDDAIEIVILPDNLTPPDTMGASRGLNGETFEWGAHTYFTYNEKMRGITDDGEDTLGQSWSASDWTFGPDGEITSKGAETDTGWMLEVRMAKELFQGTDIPLPWYDKEGETYDIDLETYPISFAIGVDDDDAKYADRTGFELQYWWPVTEMLSTDLGNFNNEKFAWSSEEIANNLHVEFYETAKGERLNGGALGIIRLSAEVTPVSDWSFY